MSGAEAMNWAGKAVERWGFPVVIALAFFYVLRVDVLVPLVDEHRLFLRELTLTQQELSEAMREQTRLIRALEQSNRLVIPQGWQAQYGERDMSKEN